MKNAQEESTGLYRRIIYFFPVQLLVLHFKKNHALLAICLILISLAHGFIGKQYGVSQLFLYPEYRGETGFISFSILGFAYGGFILAFNLYTYILHGYRFRFIASLAKPFVKFSVNNAIIPAIMVLTYLIHTALYQFTKELESPAQILVHLSGFIFGMTIFLVVSSFYFLKTNKSYNPQHSAADVDFKRSLVSSVIHNSKNWSGIGKRPSGWLVETYFAWPFSVKKTRSVEHYDKNVLESILSQNHLNGSIFEAVLFLSFIFLGGFGENPVFVIPAAASGVLLLTMLLMIFSALFTWLRGWTYAILLASFLLINHFHGSIPLINVETRAYGLNYESDNKPNYSKDFINQLNTNDSLYNSDFNQTLGILDNWRKKQLTKSSEKPKLVLISTSGGGHRSALWTMVCLQNIHKQLGYSILDKAQLITGSSGGMLGAGYYRELYLRNIQKEQGFENLLDTVFQERIAMDLLNPIMFKLATNDVFIRYRKFRLNDNVYTKDRAYAFEKRLNFNTEDVMNKTMGEYVQPEKEAIIPMFVMVPTIVRDGRRLFISSNSVSYLTRNSTKKANPNAIPEAIDFGNFFGINQSNNLQFTSALRMNATFPYILPMTSLPSSPPIEVMDAGLRDNFGTKTITQYIFHFRNWINTNTSGVVIIQFRDLPKGFSGKSGKSTLMSRLAGPVGSVYGNVTGTQDFTNDQLLQFTEVILNEKVEMVMFQLMQSTEREVSLSWHLSKSEKKYVKNAVNAEENINAMSRLKELLEE